MFGYWSDLEGAFSTMGRLRRRMEYAFGDVDAAAIAPDGGWPRTSVHDAGGALVVVVDLPGVKEKDLEIVLEQDVLSLAGERRIELPEGHAPHRQERRAARFSRSFKLPCKVNADALSAELKDGVLTIQLPKAAEAQARRIDVKAAG